MKKNRIFPGTRLAMALATLAVLSGCASKSPAPVYDRGGRQAAATASAQVGTYTVKSGDTLYSIARDLGMDHRELIAMNNIENPNQISVGRVLKIKSRPAASSEVATTAPVSSDVVVTRPISDAPVVERRPVAAGGASTEKLKREPRAGKEPYSDQALAQAQREDQPKPAEAVAPAAKAESKPEEKSGETSAGGDEVAWIWPASGKVIGSFTEDVSKGIDISGKAGDPVMAVGDGKVGYSGSGLRGYGKMVIIKHNANYVSVYAHNQNILVKEGQTVTKGQKIAEMGSTDAEQVKLHFEIRRQGKPVNPLKYLPQR